MREDGGGGRWGDVGMWGLWGMEDVEGEGGPAH
jgi:hypothetical protein